MSQNNQEIEAKFAVRGLAPIQARLSALGAICISPRQMEFNLRYDTPDGHLSATGQVLRLRRYDDIRITYKGPGVRNEGVLERAEIETTLGNLDSARLILESLGYTPIFTYEKYRAVWQLDENQIMLDEMPFGAFVEIESPNAEGVRALARQLDLDPHTAIPASYQALFERAKVTRRLTFSDITFANFAGITINPEDFQAEFAEVSA
ncbi:MAG: class IV adenylate cyclase [Anaerolineales bacterium]